MRALLEIDRYWVTWFGQEGATWMHNESIVQWLEVHSQGMAKALGVFEVFEITRKLKYADTGSFFHNGLCWI